MDADGDETLSWNEFISFLSQQQSHLWDEQETKNVAYLKEQSSISYPIGNHIVEKLIPIPGEKTPKTVLNSAKMAILTYVFTFCLNNVHIVM